MNLEVDSKDRVNKRSAIFKEEMVSSYTARNLHLVTAIPEIPISGFPEIPFFPKSRNSGIFQAKIPESRDFHFLHYLMRTAMYFQCHQSQKLEK